MCLIQDHIVPSFPAKYMSVSAGQSVGRDARIERERVIPALSQFSATFRTSVITKDAETWQKFLELHLPVEKNARRNDN